MIFATVTGHLGKNAETREAGKDLVTSFSVASSKKIKGEEVTVWVTCNLWGERGTKLAQYLTKGSAVTVVGELSTREYEGKNGKGFSVELRVSDVALQGGKHEGAPRHEGAAPAPQGRHTAYDDPSGGDESEIPFIADMTGRRFDRP